MKPATFYLPLAILGSLITCESSQAQQTSFIAPDTVCLNAPFNVTNTSTGATTYSWNFCVSSLESTPNGISEGNPGNVLYTPVFMDLAQENGIYYAFSINHYTGELVCLNFGNSYLNSPTATDLGNCGVIPDYSEGIQVVHLNGMWTAIIAGGNRQTGARLLKVDLGVSLSNLTPVGTDWGNIGSLAFPNELTLLQDTDGTYHAFTVNLESNTITRFDFGNTFATPPAAINLGNIGNLNEPVGICAIQENSNWYLFLTNDGGNTLTRLDLGQSLVNNSPVAVNLGNPGNTLNGPRDFSIIRFCGQDIGFESNQNSNDLCRFNFPGGVTTMPTAVSLGNIAQLSFPCDMTKIFQVGSNLYMFIVNESDNTFSRIAFNGCSSQNIPASTAFTPNPVSYSAPGMYDISLLTDVGLPTQNSFCQNLVVLPSPQISLPADTSFCPGSNVTLSTTLFSGSLYQWNTGQDSNAIVINTSGKYWLDVTDGSGCKATDTVTSALLNGPMGYFPKDTVFCDSGVVRYTTPQSVTYLWSNGSVDDSTQITSSGSYWLQINLQGCAVTDTVHANIFSTARLNLGIDSVFCGNGTLNYTDTTAGVAYQWNNGSDSSKTEVTASGLYTLMVSNQGCVASGSLQCSVLMIPSVQLGNDTSLCLINPYVLQAGPNPGGYTYQWQDGSSESSYTVTKSGVYSVTVMDNGCAVSDSVEVTAAQVPKFTLGMNQPICQGETIYLKPSQDSLTYTWQNGTTDSVLQVAQPGMYSVIGSNGCGSFADTVTIYKGICVVHVPNAFTPNGDGNNDIFRVLGTEVIDQYDLAIFNRWGQRIFGSEDKDLGWDGTLDGVNQPTGVYVYTLHFRYMITGESYSMGGTVTLIR